MEIEPFNGNLTLTQKLRLALFGMAVIVLGGMTGFMIIEELSPVDALYTTIITLSTVGYGDVIPHSDTGRIFVIFLIVFGVALGGFTISIIGQIILEGQIRGILGRKKMDSKISKMSNHYIIAGYGRVGRQVALEFKNKKVPFLVLEKDSNIVFNLYKDGVLFIQGEATDEEVLRKAGIDNAKTLISTLPDEAQNVYLTLTARYMNPKLHIIARADYEEGIIKLERAGANHVVTPHVLGGIRMAMASLRPNVVDFMHSTSLGAGGLTIEEFKIPMKCDVVGNSIRDSKLKEKFGVNIIGIKKKDKDLTVAPGPDTIIEAEDILVLIGHTDGLEKLSKTLSP